LPSKRSHVFDQKEIPFELKGLTGERIREVTIITDWPDVLRAVATMLFDRMQPSQLLKELTAHPCQNDLAIALREIEHFSLSNVRLTWTSDATPKFFSKRARHATR
jgi:TnpA family transposase